MTESDTHAVRISELTFRYPGAETPTLRVPGLAIASGEFVSVLGASGSGKSTLLRVIANILPAATGTVSCEAVSRNQVGMVFQSPNLIPWYSAAKNIRLPTSLGKQPYQINSDAVAALLQLVGLTEKDRTKRTTELSGGMQMRVALARALVLQPQLLLMDEPFGAVDDLLRIQLESDVRAIHRSQSLTTLLVTHNIAEAVFMSDRILVLGGQPSTIHADLKVSLPADRTPSVRQLPEFQSLQAEVLQALRDGQPAVSRTGDSRP